MNETNERPPGGRAALLILGTLSLAAILLVVWVVFAADSTTDTSDSPASTATTANGTTPNGTRPPVRPTPPTRPTPSSDETEQVARLLDETFVLATSENCREIFVEFEDLLFRSRDFSSEWGPDTSLTGAFVKFSPTEREAIFLTDEGIEVVFYGGEGAVFTADCPRYFN
jgi:hypothetical protein